jgi:hypothetical protein
MPDQAPCSNGGGTPLRSSRSQRVQELMAHGQRLVDRPRPAGIDSIRWYVQAQFVGDLAALAAAALHESPVSPGPPAG